MTPVLLDHTALVVLGLVPRESIKGMFRDQRRERLLLDGESTRRHRRVMSPSFEST